MRLLFSAAVLIIALATNASAQQTIFLVRHAERADVSPSGTSMTTADPDLSDAGRARAQSLATILKDANITAIFTTEFKRTQQTASPLASSLGIQTVTLNSKEPAKLLQALKEISGNALIVGHSNTIPAIIKDLGVTTTVTLGDTDYDNLFIVATGQPPRMVRLHYR
jgi:broad specificity phosphatase PhoE